MSKHTKGEWIAVGAWVEHPNDKVADICNCDPKSMGQRHLSRSNDEIFANARLIAAAPDMLNALEIIHEYCNYDKNDHAMADALSFIIETAEQSIAKAKGRSMTIKDVVSYLENREKK